jgi:hypothetical protein
MLVKKTKPGLEPVGHRVALRVRQSFNGTTSMSTRLRFPGS